jgi:hypothetical protein
VVAETSSDLIPALEQGASLANTHLRAHSQRSEHRSQPEQRRVPEQRQGAARTLCRGLRAAAAHTISGTSGCSASSLSLLHSK